MERALSFVVTFKCSITQVAVHRRIADLADGVSVEKEGIVVLGVRGLLDDPNNDHNDSTKQRHSNQPEAKQSSCSA